MTRKPKYGIGDKIIYEPADRETRMGMIVGGEEQVDFGWVYSVEYTDFVHHCDRDLLDQFNTRLSSPRLQITLESEILSLQKQS